MLGDQIDGALRLVENAFKSQTARGILSVALTLGILGILYRLSTRPLEP